jgi:hypothetical protein
MPLVRYFLYVGGVLVALIFIVDSYLSKLPIVENADPHRPKIRIYSDDRWPERVIFDTSIRPITPSQPAEAEANIPTPAVTAEVPVKAREAFAELQPTDTLKVQSTGSKAPEPKPQRQRKIAKRHAPPMHLVWRQPPFGWYGGRSWW